MTTFKIKLVWTLVYLFVGALAVYLYVLNSLIFDVAGRQRAWEKLTERQAAMVALEKEYLARTSRITLELAYELGFRDAAAVTTFVSPKTAETVLSRRPTSDGL